MRTAVWVGVAFVVGALLGAAALWDGSSAPRAPASPRATGGPASIVLVVDNVGTHALNASLEVSRLGGGSIWSGVLLVPAADDREHTLGEAREGKFSARGRFTWADPPRRGTGDFIIAYDGDECGAQDLHVVFRVDSTNGISFPDGEIKECR